MASESLSPDKWPPPPVYKKAEDCLADQPVNQRTALCGRENCQIVAGGIIVRQFCRAAIDWDTALKQWQTDTATLQAAHAATAEQVVVVNLPTDVGTHAGEPEPPAAVQGETTLDTA